MATKEELEKFYRENRIRQALSVAPTVFDDPANAPTIFGSSLPVNQVARNLQVYGDRLKPAYNPTFRDKTQRNLTSAFDYLKSKGIMDKSVREGKSTTKDVATSFSGSEGEMGLLDFTPMGSLFAAQEGQRKVMEAEPNALKRQMGLLSCMRQPLQTYLDRPKLAEGAFDMSAGAVEALGFGYVARPFLKKIKPFADSLIKKLKGETSNVATKQEVGALPKVIANTKLKAPSMAMTDPKVVDEFGFYSEAERQAKMMQQNKGSGAQFQGMLLNKGVKLDEMKALGLDELFKNEKVTKKEIVDTIDLNKFQLIEKKRSGDPINNPNALGFGAEQFTDMTKPDGTAFSSADEVRIAMDTGEYTRPKIEYDDGTFNGFDVTLDGTVDTHVATGYKIVSLVTRNNNKDEVFLTFKPDAKTDDWRNSIEAKQYVGDINDEIDTQGFYGIGGQTSEAKTENLTIDDFDTILQEYAPYSFDEAGIRLRAAAEGNLGLKASDYTKFESNTQKGGENYKEFVLSLPPFDKTKGYQDKVDIRFTTHFPEYNPVFHIRTKDRVTTDGKKVLYVEELQSDFGQQGRERGFKLKGDDLEKAKANLLVAEDNLMKLKDIQVKLTPTEVENLFKLKNPNKVMIDPNDENILTTVNSLTPESNAEIVNPYKAPPEYAYATIEEVAKLRQYENYKALHKLGDISDEFFNQLDLSQMGRTRDEIKEQIVGMFYGERLDRGAVTYPYSALAQSGRVDITRNEADNIINKYYKAKNQAQGEDAPIPDAPFVKDTEKWTGLAIKRLLQMAEKGDYDHIAFSPGQVQFDRWREDGLIKYYDEIIPNVARDVTKKMKDKSANINTTGFVDIKIPKDNLDTSGIDVNNQKTFAINITPKMKDIVRGGMPLFSTVGGMVGLGALGSMPSTQDGGT